MNLPDGWRVTAYWWSACRGLPVTLEALRELGSTAAFEAWWLGVPEQRIPEGSWPSVHTWPAEIWLAAEARLRDRPHDCPGPSCHPYPAFGDDPARWGLSYPPPMTPAELEAVDREMW